jgi:hypothetical protein
VQYQHCQKKTQAFVDGAIIGNALGVRADTLPEQQPPREPMTVQFPHGNNYELNTKANGMISSYR